MMAILYTILTSVLATVFSVVLGTLFAFGINSLSKKKRKYMIIGNNVPILNADIVTGVSLFFVFKLFGTLIGSEYILGFATLLISHIFFCTPYVVLSVLPKLSEIDTNLYDAALDLGCKKTKALWKVVVPSIKTGIFSGALLAFVMSFDDFVISYLVAGAEVKNFSMWFYSLQRATKTNAWPQAYAYNTIISVVAITALAIYGLIKVRKERIKKIKIGEK
jgi:spermidine/putrescine transport system permease protein